MRTALLLTAFLAACVVTVPTSTTEQALCHIDPETGRCPGPSEEEAVATVSDYEWNQYPTAATIDVGCTRGSSGWSCYVAVWRADGSPWWGGGCTLLDNGSLYCYST